MLRFAFILTLFNATGDAELYVMDSNMTGEDCVAAIQHYVQASPNMSRGLPSCELDMAQEFIIRHNGKDMILPACNTEDSDNCLWDAQQHGNGKGHTFYVLQGQVFYID